MHVETDDMVESFINDLPRNQAGVNYRNDDIASVQGDGSPSTTEVIVYLDSEGSIEPAFASLMASAGWVIGGVKTYDGGRIYVIFNRAVDTANGAEKVYDLSR